MTPFDPHNASTWPASLTLAQVAAIYQRTVEAVRCALKPTAKHLFRPAPHKTHPYRWRREDVMRDLFPARKAS